MTFDFTDIEYEMIVSAIRSEIALFAHEEEHWLVGLSYENLLKKIENEGNTNE